MSFFKVLVVIFSFIMLTCAFLVRADEETEKKPKVRNPEASHKLIEYISQKRSYYTHLTFKEALDLVYEGADPEYKDKNGVPLLVRLACDRNWSEVSKYLVQFYPDKINIADSNGKTSAMCVAIRDYSSLDFYLGYGADPELRDKTNRNVLHHLLENGFDTEHHRSLDLPSPDHAPSRTDAALQLLGKKTYFTQSNGYKLRYPTIASVEQPDQNGVTPLMWASRAFNSEVLDAIISLIPVNKRLQYINQRDNNGLTAIFYAVKSENTFALSWLIQNGALVNLVDAQNYSPLFWAMQTFDRSRLALTSLLIFAGADRMSIFSNDQENNYWVISTLINRHDPSLLTLFSDLDLNWKMKSKHSRDTLLHLAIQRECPSAVRTLLELGADANQANNNGFTPLMYAAEREDLASFLILLPKTENKKQKTAKGQTIEDILKAKSTRGFSYPEIREEMLRLLE